MICNIVTKPVRCRGEKPITALLVSGTMELKGTLHMSLTDELVTQAQQVVYRQHRHTSHPRRTGYRCHPWLAARLNEMPYDDG